MHNPLLVNISQIVIKYTYIILEVNLRVHTALVCPSNTRSHINIDEYFFLKISSYYIVRVLLSRYTLSI
jgi:hypothetical protein